ncbi:MAG: branched-chain amino acid ABC transporter permease [Verrucomicrobiota bacterium]
MNYIYHLIVILGIYSLLAYSLNLTLGYGGLLSLCHAAFYGIGAYIYALCLSSLDLPGLACLFLSIFGTGTIALLIGSAALRFRGNIFIFVTLGFQMIVFVVLYNWVGLTNGPYGISGISRPSLFGFQFHTPLDFALLVIVANVLVLSLLFAIYRSPFGLVLKAIREDEVAAETVGIRTSRVLLQAFVLSGAIAAIPGAIYATYTTYIDPTSFTFSESITIAVMLLLGGAGNKTGPVLGVLLVLLLPEALRFLGMPDTYAHNSREIIYGLVLVGLMYARPRGLFGDFEI